MTGVLRRVVSIQRYRPKYAPAGAWAVALVLACGHELRRKGSRRVPVRAHCPFCPMPDASTPAESAAPLKSAHLEVKKVPT